jgi:hypothetical protein
VSRELISRSPDLQRLIDDGYEIEIRAGHLLLHVPYVNMEREVKRGTLVSKLAVAGDVARYAGDHVVFFIGEQPCNRDGFIITGIVHQQGMQALAENLTVDRSFSNKPSGSNYADYHAKMTRYADIISAPAQSISPGATAKTFMPIPMDDAESVFEYMDTASTRAGIRTLTAKLAADRIGIIGLGGTGAYILDFVAKTLAQEIHLFEGDRFVNHNSFRAPGAASIEELRLAPNKAAHFRDVYSKMRRGIVAHEVYVTSENLGLLDGLTFVFVCIDRPSAKAIIFEKLQRLGVPFVDAGMGIEVVAERLRGHLRVTTSSTGKQDHLSKRVSTADGDDADDYRTNIQISELNAMSATMAVIKWKKLRGFYADAELEHNSTYTIEWNMLTSDERQ